ncbi:DUF6153 family protein [Candidatus Blastococcus massiliensis]|uniref:DUF6153 family protein n=1 Tax=Candidatus Blastococcus massiliensis TaxID=1470358 RepID=UPI00058C812F|nr:DUF6153 family protein [Candidatus Blastococcus massiliensis]
MAVLILLAAVFSMHGIPFLGADSPTSETAAPTHVAMAAATGTLSVAEIDLFERGDAELLGDQQAPTESHGVAEHLWGACLAILLAGIALLAVVTSLRRRQAPPCARATGALSRPQQFLAAIRPPDLSVLCVLRT